MYLEAFCSGLNTGGGLISGIQIRGSSLYCFCHYHTSCNIIRSERFGALTVIYEIHEASDSLVVSGVSEYASTGRRLSVQTNEDFLRRMERSKTKLDQFTEKQVQY